MVKCSFKYFQICEKGTEEIKELFCFRNTLKLPNENKSEDDLMQELDNLVNLDVKASYIKGKQGEELKAVKIEFA